MSTKPTTHQHINFPPEACKNFELKDGWKWAQGICPESLKKARPECPPAKLWVFKNGEEPTELCDLHAAIPDFKYPLDRTKPSSVPHLVCAVLGLHVQAWAYTDEQLRKFAEKISLAGVDYVRMMMSWDCVDYQSVIETTPPFKHSLPGPNFQPIFNLDIPNHDFDFQLNRVRKILEPYHIKVWFDLFDNCAADCSPWLYNEQGCFGIYDSSPTYVRYAFDWLRRLERVFPASEGHIIGIGNEMQYGDDTMSAGMENWVRTVVLPMGETLLDLGYPNVPFSAHLNTGHWMHGAMSPDVSTKFKIDQAPLIVHAAGLPEDFDGPPTDHMTCESFSQVRSYGYSDDGAQVHDPAKQGNCTDAGQACTANTHWRIETVKKLQSCIGTGLYSIEFLPRNLSGARSPDQILDDDLTIYNDLCQNLYGFDPRRHYAS